MSGLSIRTIQRIENGENAGLESIKALAAVFETTIIDSDKNIELEQSIKQGNYIQHLKGFYKLITIALLSLLVPLILAINDANLWIVFLWILFSWVILIGIYSLNVFDFFGDDWKNKMIEKKFGKK